MISEASRAALAKWVGVTLNHGNTPQIDELIRVYEQSKWVKVGRGYNLPTFGVEIILKMRGVVQNETYILDQSDDDYTQCEPFWHRPELDESPIVSESDEWQPLPKL